MPKAKYISYGFPSAGINKNFGYSYQPQNTTVDAQNVRAYDPSTGRARGGQRPGITRYLAAQANGSNRIQCLTHTVESAAYGGATDLDTRTITPVAMSGGNLYTFNTSSFSLVGSGGEFSSTAPVVFSTRFNQDIYFADGASHSYYDVSAGAISAITNPSAGTAPVNGSNYPRLIATYRNRLVYSGINGEPQNWYASAVGETDNWDYSPASVVSTQAVAGNNGSAVQIPDNINSLVDSPDNDVLGFGCDHSIWQMTGDPAAGGAIDQVSSIVGMAWGRPWCRDDEDSVWFFGSRGGIYRWRQGSSIERITAGSIEADLASVDLNANIVRLVWDDSQVGFYVFISPLTAGSTTHYFYDKRNNSWWKDVFADNDFNPVAVHVFDGDAPADRVVMLGGEDSRVRYIDSAATDDDTSAISSYVYLGPFQSLSYEDVLLSEIQAVLGESSSDVTIELFAGDTPEAAFSSTVPRFSGKLRAGLGRNMRPRVRSETLWAKLSNTASSERWQFEQLRAKLTRIGGKIAKVAGA